jgi:hypothetical protein
MTAVYGGSKSLIDRVVLLYMFGTTYPIFDVQGVVSEYVRNPDLAEYVRWEYRPADRSSVIRSIKRHGTASRRRVRFTGATRIVRRLRAWVKAFRETPGGPIESGLVYRAMLREKVL